MPYGVPFQRLIVCPSLRVALNYRHDCFLVLLQGELGGESSPAPPPHPVTGYLKYTGMSPWTGYLKYTGSSSFQPSHCITMHFSRLVFSLPWHFSLNVPLTIWHKKICLQNHSASVPGIVFFISSAHNGLLADGCALGCYFPWNVCFVPVPRLAL